MREREPILVGGLVTLLVIFWLGFPVHASPDFAGSFWGGLLAVTGSALMLIPFVYLVIKRVRRLKEFVKRFVSMRTVLAWHIYAGVLGPILVLMHTGHKYQSPLGIALTAMTLIVVISGFIGRFLMGRISRNIKSKQIMLKNLNQAYEQAAEDLPKRVGAAGEIKPYSRSLARPALRFLLKPEPNDASTSEVVRAVEIAESIGDLEFAIRTHVAFKHAFRIWLRTHIVISMALYALMLLHIWASIHFGLRWFI